MDRTSNRAGTYIRQPHGYKAFRPTPLPPSPPIKFDSELIKLTADASEAIGRIDGVASTLPDPDFFVAMYVRREAVLSSQIEGTQASLEDVLEKEAGVTSTGMPADVIEPVNYIASLNHGLQRLESLPLSLRLIREIHEILMKDTRGAHLTPGEFRTSQNWIGSHNSKIDEALFVPPAVDDLMPALSDLENYLHKPSDYPGIIDIGLIHAQFETIHPFLDGNGRVGRLLIAFLLHTHGLLERPLLYLSLYFKKHRAQYYDRLQAVRDDGQWEEWLKFYLKGVIEVSHNATELATKILELRNADRRRIETSGYRAAGDLLLLLDNLFQRPLVTVSSAQKVLQVESYSAANKKISKLVEMGILSARAGMRRNRVFRYQSYLALFDDL